MTCNSPRTAAVLQQARTALLTAVLTAAVAAAIPSAAAAAQDGQVTFTKDIAPILVEIAAGAPDWWGPIGDVPVGLTEDRYVAAVEMREVNDLQGRIGGQTVGGRFVFHHLCWGMVAADGATRTRYPCHEVGRNADIFDPDGGRPDGTVRQQHGSRHPAAGGQPEVRGVHRAAGAHAYRLV